MLFKSVNIFSYSDYRHYHHSSFVNDPVFNGSHDIKALPEEPEYEDLPCEHMVLYYVHVHTQCRVIHVHVLV